MSFQQRVKTAWKKFKELQPVLSPPATLLSRHVAVYTARMCAMLHASETWPLTKPSLQCLQRNDRVMIRQICNVKPQDTATIRSTELFARLGTEDLDLILKDGMDMWNAPTVQSRQLLIYRLMESVGLGGPRRLGSS